MTTNDAQGRLAALGTTSTDGRGPNASLIGTPGSLDHLGTPALVLDLDAVEANIASSVAHSKTHAYDIRPVAKIHKSAEIAKLQIEAGGVGLCCSTLAECETMASHGFPGVLLFAPVVSDAKLERLARLNAEAEGLVVVADDDQHVVAFSRVARRSGRQLQVLVDLEVGGLRTGVGVEAAVKLAHLIERTAELEFAGVHAYVGTHQKIVDYEERLLESRRNLEPLAELIEELERESLIPRIVSGGGTGTHDFDPGLGLFTEIQLGTYVFMDASYRSVVLRKHDAHPFVPSLWVRTTVVSTAKSGMAITDAGMKQLDGIRGIDRAIILRGASQDAGYRLVGDDLGRVEFDERTTHLRIGDTLDVMPPHCYQTICGFSHYHVVRGDRLVDIWPIDALASW